MKFNEKLIELRKKEGLSQEELGYKLNVTRQTISKWELGQTTPEMDKLVEMSKIFNISVDELINESEITPKQNPIIEDQPIGEKSTKEKNIKIIIVGALVIVIVLIVFKLFIGLNILNKVTDTQGNIFNNFFSIFDKATNTIEQAKEKDNENENNIATENFSSSMEIFNETENRITLENFNGHIEILSGTQMGVSVTVVLDEIITSNKTEERKITVKYMEIETQDENEIKSIKQKIGTFDNYEITFEYDEEGFINKAIIEKL